MTTYGQVTRAALTENFHELDNDWDPDLQFTALLSHHCKIQQFAANEDPISDTTLLMKGMAVISKTGQDLDLFDRCPPNEQTYNNFKIAFAVADMLYHTKMTTAKAGYHMANAAKQSKMPQSTSQKKLTRNPAGVWYCWTHGIMDMAMFNIAVAHNSDSCKYPAKGHIKDSTFINMCGGNNNNRCLPAEKPVYEYVPREKTARKKCKYNDKDITTKKTEA